MSIENVNVLDQYKKDSIEYAIEVNRRRQVPDGKDGLKTVQRRILDVMFFDKKCVSEGTKSKSMSVVGATLGKSHPHSDTSVYDAMKPMTNWFEIYMPYITGSGSWGSMQGDGAAAARYTECHLSPFCTDVMMGDLKHTKAVVDWLKTFNEENMEPEYLPVALPVLLINGAFGIGYGMRTDVPVHNINDVIDATIALIRDPNAEIVIKPDQCMPCEIVDTNWKKISNTGFGTFTVRGRIDIETQGNNTYLVIKSTPDLVYLNSIIDAISNLIREKKILDIKDMWDESTGDDIEDANMRFMIQLKPGVDPNYVKSIIYKNTSMKKTIRVNMECLIDYKPVRLSYKAYLQFFIEFRKDTLFRLYCNRLQKVETDYHRTEAFVKLLESGEINEIIELIKKRKSGSEAELVQAIMKKLNITDMQANYIINASLKQLSPLYLDKYRRDAAALLQTRQEFLNKILNEEKLLEEIEQELIAAKEKYGAPRRCTFVKDTGTDIPEGEFKIIITENNFIKKIPSGDSFGTFKNDSPKLAITIQNTDNLLIFDDKGKVFNIPVHKLPVCGKNTNGIDVRTIIRSLTSDIKCVFSENEIKQLSKCTTKHYLAMVTKYGFIKRMDLDDFVNVPPSGIITIKLDNGDSVVDYKVLHDKLQLVLYTKDKALRLPLSEFPHQKRATKGLRTTAITSMIEGMNIVSKNTTDIVALTNTGKVNRFPIQGLPVSSRTKAANKVIKLDKGEDIFSIHTCNSHETLAVTTMTEKYTFNIEDFKPGSSISKGVKILGLKNDSIVRSEILR